MGFRADWRRGGLVASSDDVFRSAEDTLVPGLAGYDTSPSPSGVCLLQVPMFDTGLSKHPSCIILENMHGTSQAERRGFD